MAGLIVSAELGGNSIMTLYPTETAGTMKRHEWDGRRFPAGPVELDERRLNMMHMDGMWMGPGMWWAMWVFPTIFLVALVALGIWGVRRFSDRRPSSDARRILEERFARGEIDAEEFRNRSSTLDEGTRE
jgi:putative membrane protein